jgi:tRNA 2-thiouridine synthesizing protein A
MATHTIDAKGLSCPQPVLRLAAKAPTIPAGDTVELLADCATFPDDVRKWCDKLGKVLISCTTTGGVHRAQIQF